MCTPLCGLMAIALDGSSAIPVPEVSGVVSVATARDRLYLGGYDGVIGIDTATGRLLPWRAPVEVWGPMLATDEYVYAARSPTDGTSPLKKIDARTGVVLPWARRCVAPSILEPCHLLARVADRLQNSTGRTWKCNWWPWISGRRPEVLAQPDVCSVPAKLQHRAAEEHDAGADCHTSRDPRREQRDGDLEIQPFCSIRGRSPSTGPGRSTATSACSRSAGTSCVPEAWSVRAFDLLVEAVPTTPTGLATETIGATVRLHWTRPSDGDPVGYQLEAGRRPARGISAPRGCATSSLYDVAGAPARGHFARVRRYWPASAPCRTKSKSWSECPRRSRPRASSPPWTVAPSRSRGRLWLAR